MCAAWQYCESVVSPMRYELKKLLGFREMWIGGLLLTAYLLFGTITESSEAQDWPLIFQFITRFGAFIFPVFLIIGLSRLFCYEYNEHTDGLIHACKTGKKKSFRHKIAVSALYLVCAAVFVAVIALIIYVLPLGIGHNSFAHEGAQYGVFTWSNLGVYAFQVLLMIAGGLPVAGFILLLSTFIRRGAVVMTISGGLYGLLLIYDTFMSMRLTGPVFQAIGIVLQYSPVRMINLRAFGYQDIWGYNSAEVSRLIILLLMIAAITMLELCGAYRVWTRRAEK